MKGTEKQRSWAKTIKSEEKINALCDALISNGGINAQGTTLVENMRAWLLNNEDAGWWIENRVDFDCNSGNYVDLNMSNAKSVMMKYWNAIK